MVQQKHKRMTRAERKAWQKQINEWHRERREQAKQRPKPPPETTAPMIRFPANMLTTITKAPAPIAGNKRKRGNKEPLNLLGFPNEILLKIFEYLDPFDSATLALACKRLASLAIHYSQLDLAGGEKWNISWWKPHQEGNFLKKRLGDKWFGKDMRYCYGCQIYVPREKSHWVRVFVDQGWESEKRQNINGWWHSVTNQQMLTQWESGMAFKCPRCKF